MLYPNPANSVVSIQRVLNFDADPDAVEFMLNDLPSDPVDIEKAVLSTIPYRDDWDFAVCPGIVLPLNKCWSEVQGTAKHEPWC